MVCIELQHIRLRAFHGIYEGETKIGSMYDLSIKIFFEEGKARFDDLQDTINYADVYALVKQRMQVPTRLLEKVAEGIISRIKLEYPNTREIVLSIFKLQPPIENFEGKVGVTMQKRFDV